MRARLHPSGGFLLIVFSWVGLFSLIAYGFSEPDLDRIWQIQRRMEHATFTGLNADESRFMERMVVKYPKLAEERLDGASIWPLEPTEAGWTTVQKVHLLIAPCQKSIRVRIEVEASEEALPLTVGIEGIEEPVTFEENGSGTVFLPPNKGSKPRLTRVLLNRPPWRPGSKPARGVRFLAMEDHK